MIKMLYFNLYYLNLSECPQISSHWGSLSCGVKFSYYLFFKSVSLCLYPNFANIPRKWNEAKPHIHSDKFREWTECIHTHKEDFTCGSIYCTTQSELTMWESGPSQYKLFHFREVTKTQTHTHTPTHSTCTCLYIHSYFLSFSYSDLIECWDMVKWKPTAVSYTVRSSWHSELICKTF